MESLWIALAGAIGVIISAAFGALGTAIMSRSQQRAAEVEHQGPEWNSFIDQMKSWTEKQLHERDTRIDALQRQIDDVTGRYRAALRYIRAVWMVFPEVKEKVTVPNELADDI